jgi:hypothetical protein
VEEWDAHEVDRLLASLGRWAGDQRAAEAAAARARERWLRQQAGEAATVEGVLVDLAERQAAVVVQTDGRTHVGRLRGTGRDVLVLDGESGAITLVALDAIRTIGLAPAPSAEEPADRASPGDRSPTGRLSMAGLLAALAADRAPVHLELRGGKRVTGTLRNVGADVLSMRLEGKPPRTVHVPIEAIIWCSL